MSMKLKIENIKEKDLGLLEVQVRVSVVDAEENETSFTWHRTCIVPGEDVSKRLQELAGNLDQAEQEKVIEVASRVQNRETVERFNSSMRERNREAKWSS